MKMFSAALTVFLLTTAIACSKPAAQTRPPDTAASSAPGTVVVPPDSPMLTRIGRASAHVEELPIDELTAPGKVEANPGRVAKVTLPVTGRITSMLVKAGDAVSKDQPLLTMQSPDADAAMSAYVSAQAAVTQAEAADGKARADLDRASDLFEHNAVAKKEVLTAESAAAQTAGAVEQARAAREQMQRRLSVLGLAAGKFDQQVPVRSPLAGKVLEVAAVPGEYRNDTSAIVVTIADLATVWVTSQVPESYIRFVQRGEQIEVSLVAYPGELFAARVSRIADTVDPQTRTVKVQAEMQNPDGRLRPEMYGSIHHVEATAPTVVVPFAAVVQDANRSVVFVETQPGRFEQRTVRLAKRIGNNVRVVDGLEPGQIVAVEGVMLLSGLVKRS
jgi:membrane fusion protein, heavy metal efflux system